MNKRAKSAAPSPVANDGSGSYLENTFFHFQSSLFIESPYIDHK
jgi:hypothetical protein